MSISSTYGTCPKPGGSPSTERATMALKDKEELIPYAKAGLSALSSMIAEPVSGWAGILSGGSLEAISRAKEASTYTPKDPKAQQHLQDLSYAMEPIGIAASDLSRKVGDKVYETTGSPLLAAGATALPEGLLSLGGLKGLKPSTSAWNPDIKPTKVQVEKAITRTLDPFNLHKGENPLEAKMYVGKGAKGVPTITPDKILETGQPGVGWRLSPDGKMKFQISDKPSTFRIEPAAGLSAKYGSPLKNIIDHKQLFDMYPELGDIKILKTSNPNVYGSFGAKWDKEGKLKGGVIQLRVKDRTDKEIMGTLLHEVQHWVQVREGFSPGSSHSKFAEIKRKLPDLQKEITDSMIALRFMDVMEKEGLTAIQVFEQNQGKISLAAAKLIKLKEKHPDLEDAIIDTMKEAKSQIKIIQGLKKRSDGWQYDRTLGEMEARDVTDMYNRENLGMDLEQTVPNISRKKTEVGGSHESVIIDPRTEALILPPQKATPMALEEVRNIN